MAVIRLTNVNQLSRSFFTRDVDPSNPWCSCCSNVGPHLSPDAIRRVTCYTCCSASNFLDRTQSIERFHAFSDANMHWTNHNQENEQLPRRKMAWETGKLTCSHRDSHFSWRLCRFSLILTSLNAMLPLRQDIFLQQSVCATTMHLLYLIFYIRSFADINFLSFTFLIKPFYSIPAHMRIFHARPVWRSSQLRVYTSP